MTRRISVVYLSASLVFLLSLAVDVRISLAAVEILEWHGVSFNATAAADSLLQDFGLTQPADWASRSVQARLKFIADSKEIAPQPLFASVNDVFDILYETKAAGTPGAREELIANSLLTNLSTTTPDERLSMLYTLLKEFKNTPASLTIYKTLRDEALASHSIAHIRNFLDYFGHTIDASHCLGTYFMLLDAQAQNLMENKDYSGAIASYSEFIKRSPDTDLAMVCWERIDTLMFDFVINVAGNRNVSVWNDAPLTTANRIGFCEAYIEQFPTSAERNKKAELMAKQLQEEDWESQRKQIIETDADAADRISALLGGIGISGYTAFDASNSANATASQKLMLKSRAQRHKDYLTMIVDAQVIAAQFPNNAMAQNKAQNAIAQAQGNFGLTNIQAALQLMRDDLKAQSDLLKEISTGVSNLQDAVVKLQTEVLMGIASVNDSLNDVNSNLQQLTATATETVNALREGFGEVNAHLEKSNERLDSLVGEVDSTNKRLKKLGDQVDDGFAGLRKTIVDVSKRDITNGNFWTTKADDAKGWLKDRAGSVTKGVGKVFKW